MELKQAITDMPLLGKAILTILFVGVVIMFIMHL